MPTARRAVEVPTPGTPLPRLAVRCLTPIEDARSSEADFSARNIHHRSTESFEAVVAKTSLMLRKTQPSGSRSGLQLASEPLLASPAAAAVPLTPQRSRFVSARLARAYANHRLRRYAEAVDDYTECLASAPGDIVVHYNRACALYALRRLEDATRDLTKAIKLDNKNLVFVESRARVFKEMGRFHEAIHDYSWLDSLRRAAGRPPLVSDEDADGLSRLAHLSLSLELEAATAASGLLPSLQSPPCTASPPLTDRNGRHGTKEWLVELLSRESSDRTASELQEALERVGGWGVFSGMDSTMVEQCLGEATLRRFSADQTIVREGATSKSFFVVLDATAALVCTSETSGAAKYRELKTLYQGDCVGVQLPGVASTDGRFLTFRTAVPARGAQFERLVSGAAAAMKTGAGLPRVKSFRSLVGLSMKASTKSKPRFVPPEPATLSCLGDVSCLALDVGAYFDILRAYEQAQHTARLAFLRSCRGFEGLPEETLSALAAVAGAKIYDPGTDVLRAGEVVTQLWLIKRGVCQVRKSITLTPAPAGCGRGSTATSRARGVSGSASGSDALSSRAVDGSWVLDNGWMLTNPRLVSSAQGPGGAKKIVTEEVTVAVLASAQLFGELSVLQPGQPSQVTVRSQTMVETLVFQAEDLSELHVQYHSSTMNALQESLLFHNPPQQKIAQLHREHERWGREKAGVLSELFPSAAEALASPARAKTAAASLRVRTGGTDATSAGTQPPGQAP